MANIYVSPPPASAPPKFVANIIPPPATANDSDAPTDIVTTAQLSVSPAQAHVSALPKHTKYYKEIVTVEDSGPPLLIRETVSQHKYLRQRIRDFEQINLNHDQIVLFFIGTPDKNGRSWHADSNQVEKAVNFMLKKLQIGGFFLKVHVGSRSDWLDMDNPFRRDPKIQLLTIPTLWVWGSSKRLFGKRCFDLESMYLLLKD